MGSKSLCAICMIRAEATQTAGQKLHSKTNTVGYELEHLKGACCCSDMH